MLRLDATHAIPDRSPRHLLAEIARRHHAEAPRLEDDAAEILAGERWPGNVRELANVLERAVILSEGLSLRAADLRPLLRPLASTGERERLRQARSTACFWMWSSSWPARC